MGKPLPTLEWLHICDHAFRDEFGKLCMIGLFDALHSYQLPGRLPVFSVAFGLTDGAGQYKVGLRIQAPSGQSKELPLPPMTLKSRQEKTRTVIRLAGMPFEEFGRYTFRLVIDQQPMDYPVHVLDHVQMQQQPPAGGPPPAAPPPTN